MKKNHPSKNLPPAPVVDADTRDRLITVGGECFARHGLEETTVREICALAGTNVAAVNYHFGGKQGLYRATFLHFYETAIRAYPPDFGVKPGDPPPELLRAFIKSFFLRVFDQSKPHWMAELMLREMISPTGVLDELVDRQMVNMRDRLMNIVQAIVGSPLTERQMFKACTSIVAQIVFHKHCQPIITRMWPKFSEYSMDQVDALAEHVWRFSLAGLAALRDQVHHKSGGDPSKAAAKRKRGRA